MSIYAIALSLASANAHAAAAPDLTTSIIAPSGTYVEQSAKWQFKVSNGGTKDAAGVAITVQLPQTNTSPTVYVMGTVDSKSSTCSVSGTTMTCSVGTVRKSKSTTVYAYLTLPESAGTLDFAVTASTTTAESNTSNNSSSAIASLLNYEPTFTGTANVTNRHCTGTGLESFYECELYPSSISEHAATFVDDGTIAFDGMPEYGGSWSLLDEELTFEYTEYGAAIAWFVGYGVPGDCWEGLTDFGSTYVAPYEVCLD